MNQIQVSIIKGFHTLSLKTYKCALRPLKEIIYDPKREKRESYSFDVDSVRIQISLCSLSLPCSFFLSTIILLHSEGRNSTPHLFIHRSTLFILKTIPMCSFTVSIPSSPKFSHIFFVHPTILSGFLHFTIPSVCLIAVGVTGSSKQKIWAALANTNLKL